MTDPMESLIGLQEALIARTVQLQKCELHPSIRVLLDHPNDIPRFTYAKIEDNKVQAIALFVLTEPESGLPCFQIGYAVIENKRNRQKNSGGSNRRVYPWPKPITNERILS